MTFATALDTALDRSVILRYSRIGLAVRRHLSTWPADPPRMDGKVVLVTGAASGIGQAATVGFARLGASVRALARNRVRAQQAVDAALREVPDGDIQPMACDLTSLASLRIFVTDFTAREDRLETRTAGHHRTLGQRTARPRHRRPRHASRLGTTAGPDHRPMQSARMKTPSAPADSYGTTSRNSR